ncbi:MAG: putative metalloprotease CJM1_0395 family protein [Planctomycetota bacterium]
MALAEILSGSINLLGAAYALGGSATRIAPVKALTPPQSEDWSRSARLLPSEETTFFQDADTVELSRAARQYQDTRARDIPELTIEQQARLEDLQHRDSLIREHEAAHITAAGGYALGGARFEYETGPDGERYAVAGEVAIDTAPIVNDPTATIEKMRTVRAAALAPSDPSPEDQQVAAKAEAQMRQAETELVQCATIPPDQSSRAKLEMAVDEPESLSPADYRASPLVDTYA